MANSNAVRAEKWANWRASMTTLRDRLQELIIDDAVELFRTKDPSVLGPMVETLTAGVGFVNTDHVLKYVSHHLGVKVTQKNGREIMVEKNLDSDVWADVGAALKLIKARPYWAWKTPDVIREWNDPFNSMVRSYGVGLLLGDITLDSLKAKVGDIVASAAYKATKNSKVQTDARNKALALGREVVTLA